MAPSSKPSSNPTQQLWLQVCATRGTPAPDATRSSQFLQDLQQLDGEPHSVLQSILALAVRGREKPGDLAVLSWAAACTRPALHGQLQGHGLQCTPAELFACGLVLRSQGWDMQQRLAQLASHPEDVTMLRAMLPQLPEVPEVHPLPAPAEQAVPDSSALEEDAFYPWPNDDLPDEHALNWPGETLESPKGWPAAASWRTHQDLPSLPTRFEREPHAAPEPLKASSPGTASAAQAAPDLQDARLNGATRLRLFGKSAAHTLEITQHRRADDFLCTQVVSIDSAHSLGAGAGYDWQRKLVLQVTPEEMPALVATLMGITPSSRFGHHGATQAKFIELRRQEGGLVIVTGEHASVYSVPVPTASIYYVLELFCRAMRADGSGRSVSDILALVKAAHGF
ncbi:MAG: hypothetical protein JWR68_3245 [Polaromonas sp.]|nr:hypothetical protein [Polaromonas sp.]